MLELEDTILGHYRIQRRLCRGGMSEVYLAHDENMHRDVAIKLVNSFYSDHTERLAREAKTVTMLTHDHILPTYEYSQDGSWHYLVMPYMEQGNLRQRLLNGPLSFEETGNILEQLASALQFAHNQGILHRDIKPSNILLDSEQRVYLADFGLAKKVDEENDITLANCLIGTPEYMAPELAESEATTSSDIYALGVLLYQMVTGRVPFRGGTPLSIYWKHISELPTPPTQFNPAIPPSVEQVILRALEKDPHRRFQTAEALALAYKQALLAASQHETIDIPLPVTIEIRKLADSAEVRHLKQPQIVPQFIAPFVGSYAPHKIQMTIAGLMVIVFLLITPLSLGLLSARDTNVQEPLLLGASAAFGGLISGASAEFGNLEGTPQIPPTPASHTSPTIIQSSNPHATHQQQPPNPHGPSVPTHGHGHDHGHKHGHDHGDNPSLPVMT